MAKQPKVIDPTANVIALVKAEVTSLRREAKMRETFAHQLRKAESKRIDANLAAIVATAQRAVDTQIETAKTLAASVETARTTLENTLDQKLAPLQDFRANTYGQRESKLDSRTLLLSLSILATGVCAVAVAAIFH